VKSYYDPHRHGRRAVRDPRWSKNRVIGLGAAGVVAAIIGAMILLGNEEPAETTDVVWVAEKTTRAPSGMPDSLRARLHDLGAQDGGRLTVYAVGGKAREVGHTDLTATMEGDKVADPERAGRLLDRKLERFTDDLDHADVGRSGFSLYRALRVGADKAAQTGGPVEVWLSTTVLAGTTDPLSIARLTDAEVDPSQAVDELMNGSLKNLDMTMVTLHIVMLTPVGEEQQQLSPRSEHWRITFITELAEQLGADVVDPVPDNSIESPWRGSSEVPAIKPMVDKIPPPPPPPADPVKPPKPPRIDNASFQPNSATLIDRDATRAAVSQVIAFQRANAREYRISVVGYCARFGDADGARTTSRDRADAIAGLLRDGGVRQADIDTAGKGFDVRADTAQDPRSPAQRVVVISVIAR
jgi:outer membrane protein OmpA-like peptidoglycan-associated protein